jgi:hypothetical protein
MNKIKQENKMSKHILKLKTVLMLLISMALFCPGVFAQGHQEGRNGGNAGIINRGDGAHVRGNGHGNRHYYHNGSWNRNGWFGWGVPAPVYSNGVLVASLPPGYTSVIVAGNPYFYGNGMYFRPMSTGGFAVVTL